MLSYCILGILSAFSHSAIAHGPEKITPMGNDEHFLTGVPDLNTRSAIEEGVREFFNSNPPNIMDMDSTGQRTDPPAAATVATPGESATVQPPHPIDTISPAAPAESTLAPPAAPPAPATAAATKGPSSSSDAKSDNETSQDKRRSKKRRNSSRPPSITQRGPGTPKILQKRRRTRQSSTKTMHRVRHNQQVNRLSRNRRL